MTRPRPVRSRPAARFVLTAATAALLAVTASAQDLRVLIPAGGTRGTEVQVRCYGRYLKDTVAVAWLREGLEVRELKVVADNRVDLTLHLPEGCELGCYPLALHTRRGVTRYEEFHVGHLPSVPEASDHHTRETAQPLELDCTVDGRIDSERTDWFSLDLDAGATVTVEVEAVRLGVADIDPHLEVFGPDGALLLRADDSPLGRNDPVARFTAAAAGVHHLALRDVTWGGSSAATYRMHVGTFPRPIAVMPLGGRPGETVTARLLGGDEHATVQFVVPAELGLHELFADVDGRTSPTPVHVMAADRAHYLEGSEPDEPPAAPCAFHGVLAEPDERDGYAFRASKGERIEVRALARSFHSPVDPVLHVEDADGKVLVSNDDGGGQDSSLRFTSPADGVYRAVVRDLLGGGGDAHCYYVELGQMIVPAGSREAVPGQRAEDFGVVVPRGQRAATVIQLTGIPTRDGISLDWHDLPEGVHAATARVPESVTVVPVVFEAAPGGSPDDPLGSTLARPTARADVEPNERAIRHVHRFPSLRIRNNVTYLSRRAEGLPVLLGDRLPFELTFDGPGVPLVRSGSLSVPVSIARDEGFRGTVSIRALWLPPGVSATTVRLGGDDTDSTMRLQANSRASLGTWPLVLVASVRLDGVTCEQSSAARELQIEEPWITAKLPRTRMEQGTEAAFVIELEAKRPFEGKLRAELQRLPTGVHCEIPAFTAESTELSIALRADADAKSGRHRSMYLNLVFETDGGAVTHSVGGGELRVDRPLPAATGNASDKSPSPR